MNEIIQIKKQLIGAQEVNSVNARDLYKNLEIKKDFSDWIKVQIKSFGLEENIDYIVLSQKGEKLNGGVHRPLKEYFITLESAKHISMASRTLKGKEVRNYFIACERKLLSGTNDIQNSELIKVIMTQLQNQDARLQNQDETIKLLANSIVDLAGAVKDIKDLTYKHLFEISLNTQHIQQKLEDVNFGTTLSPDMLDAVKSSIDDRAEELSKKHNMTKANLTRLLYGKLNSFLGVETYYKINSIDFDRALKYIKCLNLYKEEDEICNKTLKKVKNCNGNKTTITIES